MPFRLTRDIVAGMGYSGASIELVVLSLGVESVCGAYFVRHLGGVSTLLRRQLGSAPATHRVASDHIASIYPRPALPLDSIASGHPAATGTRPLVVPRTG